MASAPDRQHLACPACGEQDTRIIATYPLLRSEAIRRWRRCRACGHRFATREVLAPDVPPRHRVPRGTML